MVSVSAALAVTETVVAERIEQILAKLDAPVCDLAVLRALRLGLYVPPALGRIHE